jgi:DUF4097 and DUF4098 domain-containing protein YvlB
MKQKMKYVLFILLLTFSMLAAEDYEQKINRHFDLTPAGAIELAGINGEIEVSTTSGSVVEIKAVKKSDYKGEIESVEVIFETGKNFLKVYTKSSKDNTRAKVDFTVSIPEKLARSIFKSVNGKLDCSGKFGDLTLKTVNGKVDFEGEFRTGYFNTVNGTIEISQEQLLSGEMSVETVNGGIDIELNGKSSFAVEGRTINGGIDCDFPISVQRHFIGSSLEGQVNGGGHKITLKTVNGRIRISKI